MKKNINSTEVTGGRDDKKSPKKKFVLDQDHFDKTPPAHFTPELTKIWNEVIGVYPDDAFQNTDRFQLEIFCNLLFKYRNEPSTMTTGALQQLIKLSDNFGGSIRSRNNIIGVDTEQDDAALDYLRIFNFEE